MRTPAPAKTALALAYLESAGDALVRGPTVFCVLTHGNIDRPRLRGTDTVPEAGGTLPPGENPDTAPLLVITVST